MSWERRGKLVRVQHWVAPLAVSGLALACSLTNDLSELEGTSDSGIAAGAGGIGGSGGAGGGSGLCEAACDRQLTAACPSDDLASCITDCETAPGATSTACSTTWAALLGCVSEQGSFACDTSGAAELTNCTTQAEALGACLTSGSGGTGGAGGSGGSSGTGGGGTSSCQNPYQGKTCADLQANVCSDCTATNCCPETNACLADQDCGGLYACAATCAASTDPQACVSQTCPDCFGGLSLFNQLSSCIETHCTSECSGQL